MFILAQQRDGDVVGAFAKYRDYLRENAARFPPSAYSLAASDWYFDFRDHRTPHDAWLEFVQISEPSSGERQEIRTTFMRTRLLSAYHDGYIEFYYPKVFSYSLAADACGEGLGDWRYDEFRLDEHGRLVHEIEWSSYAAIGRWIIVSDEVHHSWLPLKDAEQAVATDRGEERRSG